MKDWYVYLQRSWLARHPIARVVLFLIGLLLVLAGALLGFVPFLPGFPLGILGAILMSISSNRVRGWIWLALARLPERFRKHLHFLNPAEQGEAPDRPQPPPPPP